VQSTYPAFPVPSISRVAVINSGALASREGELVSPAFFRRILRDAASRPLLKDEVVTRGAKSDPDGEEARRAVSNHEAVEGMAVV
jgi:hypothetical protein